MQEHGEHQRMITTKHMSNSLQNTELLIFVINISLVPPITALIFTDEKVKM